MAFSRPFNFRQSKSGVSLLALQQCWASPHSILAPSLILSAGRAVAAYHSSFPFFVHGMKLHRSNVALHHGKLLYLQCLTNPTASLASAALGFFKEAYKQECVDAAYWLGQCYERGFGVPASCTDALENYREGAYHAKPSSLCMDKLGWYMLQKKGPRNVHNEGYRLVHRAMSKGDVLAIYHTSRCYRQGKGVAVDEAESLKLEKKFFTKCVAFADGFQSDDVLRDADILYALARCYEDGRVVLKCYQTCVALLERAGSGGCSQADYRLGTIYYFGHGVDRNESKGIMLCQRAATAGNVYAKTNLGMMHRRGINVSHDAQLAVELVESAAEWGHSDALMELAGCYEDGEGVEQDEQLAASLYEGAGAMGKLTYLATMAGRNVRRKAAGKIVKCGVRGLDGRWMDKATLTKEGLFPVDSINSAGTSGEGNIGKDAVWLCVCGECMEDIEVERFREWVRRMEHGDNELGKRSNSKWRLWNSS